MRVTILHDRYSLRHGPTRMNAFTSVAKKRKQVSFGWLV
jgi:hypothetical protein